MQACKKGKVKPSLFPFIHLFYAAPFMFPSAIIEALNSFRSVTIAFACATVEYPYGVVLVAAVVVTAACADPARCATGVTP
jgi:hypothetical protein